MLKAINLRKTYTPKKGVPVKALDDVSLEFGDTGLVFILGKSGSGKSTLLNVLGGLDSIDDGEIEIKGRSCKNFKQGDFDSYRNTFVGFIFQEYNILNEFTIGANIALALQLQGKKATNERVNEILDEVDLTGYGDRKPNELSGGQKQRVAIARALIKDPQIIMADEPTGALDSNTGKQVFDTLKKLAKTKLVMVVSHDREFAENYGDRVIELADGKVISDITKCNDLSQEQAELSDKFSVIDGKHVCIKKGYELTVEDLKRINELVKESSDDTVLSIDNQIIKDDKRAVGKPSFKTTTTEDIKTRQYSDEETKFIKARLPFSHALKMGVSSLKVKPFRLILTILLSCVAFIIFGVVDTGAAYDKYATATRSIIDQEIESAVFTQERKYNKDDKHYIQSEKFNNEDIATLSREIGIELTPIYSNTGFSLSKQINNSSNLKSLSSANYYEPRLDSIVVLTEDNLDAMGYTLYGKLPTSIDEIVIPMYFVEIFNLAGFKYEGLDSDDNESIEIGAVTFDTNASENSIIGKHLSYSGGNAGALKIVGVVDTKASSKGFENYLPGKGSSKLDYTVINRLNSYLKNSLHRVGLVAPEFFAEQTAPSESVLPSYVTKLPSNLYNTNKIEVKSKENISFNLDGIAPNSALSNVSYVAFDDRNADDGVYISLDSYIDIALADDKSNIEVNMAVLESSLTGKLSEKNYKVLGDYLNVGIKGEATLEFVRGLTDGQLEAIYASEEYKDYCEMFGVNTSVMSADEKKNSLSSMMLSGFILGSSSQPNKLYFDGIDGILPSGQEIIGTKIIEYVNENGHFTADSVNMELVADYGRAQFNIAGVYFPTSDFCDSRLMTTYNVIFGDDAISAWNEYGRELGIYGMVIGIMPSSYNEVETLVRVNFEDDAEFRFNLENSVMDTLDYADGMLSVLSNIMLYVSIALAVFAALLLWNYISVSVTSKRREIGILRALGARASDVFVIFFLESLIIGLIAFAVSVIGCGVAVLLLNNAVSGQLNLTILVFGIRQIMLILAVAVAVVFLGSFVPSYMIGKQKPIDAIADR